MKLLHYHSSEESSFKTAASASSNSFTWSDSQYSEESDKSQTMFLSSPSSSPSCTQGHEHEHPIHVWYFFKERRNSKNKCNCNKKGCGRARRRRIQKQVVEGVSGDSDEAEGLGHGIERTTSVLFTDSPSTSTISAITLPDELPPVAEAEAGSKFDTYYNSTADANPRKPIRSYSSVVGESTA